MFDDLNTVQDSIIEPSPSVPEEQPERSQPQPKQDDSERNLARLREDKKRIERERDEAMRRIQEMEAAQNPDLAPDDLAEGKHLKRLEEKVEQTVTEIKLKTQFPDFDKVVNTETIASLRELYPDIAASLAASPDMMSKGVSVYTLIKKLGIYREDVYQNDKEQAVTNATKPRPLASVSPQQGESPLSRANAFANGLTDELKEQLRKEMYEARRKN